MRHINKLLVSVTLILVISSCNQDFHPVGEALFIDQTLETLTESFPTFTFQEKLKKVQTNGLPLMQLGKINHPIFGQAEASFTAQLTIPNNLFFGNHRQQFEDEPDDSDPNLIPENETVKFVYLDIPFFTNQDDADNDGVIDSLDADPNDPLSNSDGDELTDLIEFQSQLNPLSSDSDGDGILDHNDDDNATYQSGNNVYQIDSVYGNREATFNLKVYELGAYLNELDPSDNFETTQAFYSTQDYYEEGFSRAVLYDDIISLNFDEIRINYKEDDPETPDVDETLQVETRLSPRLRVPLDIGFFQENFIDKEGSTDLETSVNFQKALRGIIIRAEDFSEDLYMLLDIQNAAVNIVYEYDDYQTQGTLGDTSDDTVEKVEKEISLAFNGIRINTLKNSLFDAAVQEQLIASSNNTPTNRLYVQSGTFLGKIRLFDIENQNENELIESLRGQSWLINEANLIFYIDPNLASSQELLAQRLYLFAYNSGFPLSDYVSDGSVSNFGRNSNKKIFGGLLEYDDNNVPYRYKFNITDHISNIIRNDSINFDLGLVVNADINNITPIKAVTESEQDLVYPLTATLNPLGAILIGSHPDASSEDKKVRLELIYSSYQ
ncbi:MAG: DUF4270 domain-containing protein [Flavobacteriaceae bacterium]|jgi:hypothetical protein|nr:DUF4270 domain-containing protein [Flavobacteriaceae bacterium]MBT5282967.1 DUF4270 domain-containing protein [Flavobacteriaceae bacterium]MBT5446050.1 DUF4270 domain-containing protein [Flavobacteriaceae bacterium]MBT5693713.1 DUF4270 domain-containing protein [Flavobacteriaceae bacterium]MBT6953380.1 DUF4270 domain-containing protein [Flavobacteriaceae bacterium]